MAVYIISTEPNVLTAQLTGEIDHHTSRWLRMDIDTAINDNSPAILKLDFKDVTFMDSSGIGLVIGRYKMMSERGGKIELINMPEYIERVMALAGIDKLINTNLKKKR